MVQAKTPEITKKLKLFKKMMTRGLVLKKN